MVYFTADMHFGHRALINMQNCPFESVEEMDCVLLQNFNSVVHKNDTVYILGDICHHMKVEDADDLIRKMNGKKYLIILCKTNKNADVCIKAVILMKTRTECLKEYGSDYFINQMVAEGKLFRSGQGHF